MAFTKAVGLFLVFALCVLANAEVRRFPDTIKFGVATSSYQIEGAWNVTDKTENIWDRATHTTTLVTDLSNGDVACDSYNKHKRDIEMLQELGVDYYRLSFSWGRLLPDGYTNRVSDDGVRYYNELINDLVAANITPYVTLFHWDLPQNFQDLGGWMNPLLADYFVEYAEFVFKTFGDRVKIWLTFNEPWVVCLEGYGRKNKAPAMEISGIGDYLCAHTLIKAHARAYHLYNDMFRPTQNGKVGMTLNSDWFEPKTQSDADKEAADIAIQFNLGWFAHPIFTKEGDYPKVMKDKVAQKSMEQGYSSSRLPAFTQEEIEYIRGTYDYFGLNHYTTSLISMPTKKSNSRKPSHDEDASVDYSKDPNWPDSASYWLKVVPWGIRNLLNWINENYDKPEIMVMENGFTDKPGTMNDVGRINYYHGYLNGVLDAIENGCNVTSYTAWSLMDNFEWLDGYTERFGLYYIDFNDPNRARVPKASAAFYKEIVSTRTIESYDNK